MDLNIDHRIELVTIIQTLCNYWENLSQKYFNKKLFQCKYKENINKYFKKYIKYETIDIYNKLCKEEMDISAFLSLILNYTDPPNLNRIENYNENKYEIFIDSIRKFYKETKFDYFLENNQNEYRKIINNVGNKEDLLKEINSIFEYLDVDKRNYGIIISPLVLGNFGISTYLKNYVIISPFDYKDNNYVFGSKESIKNIIWHEICHTVINDLTKKYFNQNKCKNLDIPEIFLKQLYNNIETIINEYIVRSITNILEKDKNCAKTLLDQEINSGFYELENIKYYIIENCTENNKLNKNNNYEKLINYIIEKISKSYCA